MRDDSNKGSEAVPTITKRTYKANDKIFGKGKNANQKYQVDNDKKLNMVIIESQPNSNHSGEKRNTNSLSAN